MKVLANSLLDTPEIKARLIDVEYGNLEADKLEDYIRQLYLEETGELLDGEISIYNSSESTNETIADSDYNGTAIHIDTGIHEEMYVISQGTSDTNDWLYNLKSMLAGKTADQAKATDNFVREASAHFNIDDSTEITGLSHSLGHNNNTIAYLSYNTFDEVFSVNGAQPNYYELYVASSEFRRAVIKEFSILNDNDIYEIPPNEFHDFAMDYYKDKGENINQVISKDDPLYAVSVVRGFFTLGNITMIDTNPDVPGLREMMAGVPDKVVRDFQKLAIDFTIASEKGGTNAGIEEMIGVNPSAFDGLDGTSDYMGYYLFHPGEVDAIIRSLNDKVPSLIKQLDAITENKDTIFSSLYEAGYITKDQKDIMIDEIGILDKEINELQQLLERNVDVRDTGNPFASFGGDIALVVKFISDHMGTIQGSLQRIQDSGMIDNLHKIVDSHGIPELLSAMTNGNRSYLGTDMVFTATNGDPIKVNISASLRLYREGTIVLEEKLATVSKLEEAIHEELAVSFKEEILKVMAEINQIEASPTSYASFLEEYKYPLYKVKSVNVIETFLPLKNADLDEEIDQLKKSAETGHTYIETYRKAIEDLFQEEDNISQLFDFSRRI